jgi:ribosomal protein S8
LENLENLLFVKLNELVNQDYEFIQMLKKLPKVLDNLGIAIISTSKGVMTNLKAKELGIGGEVLCYIW